MTILGIDPGTATTGFGVITIPDDILGREYEYGMEMLDYGAILTSKDDLMTHRLVILHKGIRDLIEKFKPEMIVIEMLFFGANTRTAISVGQARGVIMLAAGEFQIPIHEYTGPQVKLMVAGSGRADKAQVHEAVRKWLGKDGHKRAKFLSPTGAKPKGGFLDDATDALAIAITHVLKLAAK